MSVCESCWRVASEEAPGLGMGVAERYEEIVKRHPLHPPAQAETKAMSERCRFPASLHLAGAKGSPYCDNLMPCPIPGHEPAQAETERCNRVIEPYDRIQGFERRYKKCGKPLVDGKCADHPTECTCPPYRRGPWTHLSDCPTRHPQEPTPLTDDQLRQIEVGAYPADLTPIVHELQTARAKIAEQVRIIEAVRALKRYYNGDMDSWFVWASDLDAILPPAKETQ